MVEDFSAIVEKLQNQIFKEAKEALGELGFQRWRNPLYRGRIENPDAHARIKGKCGDTIEIFLTIHDDRIERVSFKTDGCANTLACANTLSKLTEGITVHQAWEISPEKVIHYLVTIPKEFEHCAELAVGALHKALANFQELKQSPWKKLYQKNR